MTVIGAGFAQLNYVFQSTLGLPDAEITIGLDVTASPLDPTEMADLAMTHFVDSLFPAITSNNYEVRAKVKFGPSATGPSGDSTTVSIGTNVSETAPPQVALLVVKNTNFGGRAGRGRLYYPGQSETVINESGRVTTAWRDSHQTAWETWLGKMNTDSIGPVVLHGALSPISAPSPITSFAVDTLVATQRRRLR